MGTWRIHHALPGKVGRLDFKSAGALLVSNDGALTHRLLHPSFGHTKRYEVTRNMRPQKKKRPALRNASFTK